MIERIDHTVGGNQLNGFELDRSEMIRLANDQTGQRLDKIHNDLIENDPIHDQRLEIPPRTSMVLHTGGSRLFTLTLNTGRRRLE